MDAAAGDYSGVKLTHSASLYILTCWEIIPLCFGNDIWSNWRYDMKHNQHLDHLMSNELVGHEVIITNWVTTSMHLLDYWSSHVQQIHLKWLLLMVTEQLIKNSKYQGSRTMLFLENCLLLIKDRSIKNGARFKEFKAALKSSWAVSYFDFIVNTSHSLSPLELLLLQLLK